MEEDGCGYFSGLYLISDGLFFSGMLGYLDALFLAFCQSALIILMNGSIVVPIAKESLQNTLVRHTAKE